MKKIMLFLFMCFAFINTFALTYGGCDYSTVSRMRSIVNNINVSYDYTIKNNMAYFHVTINNMTDDIYFYDISTRRSYYYADTNNGELTIYNYTNSGSYKFYSNNKSCKGITLGTKYYNFPTYNYYYNDPLCLDIPNYSLCQKWIKVNYNIYEFEQMVNEYKNSKEEIKEEVVIEYKKTFFDKIVDLYIKYYYYFLGGIIVMLTPVIIISDRKNRFKL